MFKNLIAVAALLTIPTSVMAGFSGNQAGNSFQSRSDITITKQLPRGKVFKRARGSGAVRKSERQKCLDKLLPQDGVDCLKKLKAKQK